MKSAAVWSERCSFTPTKRSMHAMKTTEGGEVVAFPRRLRRQSGGDNRGPRDKSESVSRLPHLNRPSTPGSIGAPKTNNIKIEPHERASTVPPRSTWAKT